MAVDDHRLAAILSRPIEPHRQAEFVCLAGGLAIECEGSNGSRAAAMHFLLEARMGDHELAVVEPEMAAQSIHETPRLRDKGFAASRRQRVKLREGLR